jgi:hypothetical protein
MIHIGNRNSLARMYIYYVNTAAWIQGAGWPSSLSVEGALAAAKWLSRSGTQAVALVYELQTCHTKQPNKVHSSIITSIL